MKIDKITPNIGAEIKGLDINKKITKEIYEKIYKALIDNLVIFIKKSNISIEKHLQLAKLFGQIDEPHKYYPNVKGFKNIVLLENNKNNPADTNSWHTDLTFKMNRPFASILVARKVPNIGGDTLWSNCYSAYDRLPKGMKIYLEDMKIIHDFGDFRNAYSTTLNNKSGSERLNESIKEFGHNIMPVIGRHPITSKKFLNFNEAFSNHIVGLTSNDSNSLKTFLSNHMNKPEDQVRWKWSEGDLAMWDNRVTMHYAVSDYLPDYRCMHRITIIKDKKELQS